MEELLRIIFKKDHALDERLDIECIQTNIL